MGEDIKDIKMFIDGVEVEGVKNIEFEIHHEPKSEPEYKTYDMGYQATGEFILNKKIKKKVLRKMKWWRFKYKLKEFLKL